MDEYEDSSPNSSDESAPKQDKEDHTGQTALLPKSFFPEGEVKVGRVCKIKQLAIHQDEVEVKYMPHKEESSSASEPAMSEDDYS